MAIMNTKFSQYIIIPRGGSINSLRESQKSSANDYNYRYADTGVIIYPLGAAIPVIQPGKGCIGVAIVQRIQITSSPEMTTAWFSFSKFDMSNTDDARKAKAYLSLYMTNIRDESMGDDENDVFIPGAIGSASSPEPRPSKHSSVFDDDDDDDDSFFNSIGRRRY